uniref:Uncharacterized protein n=1 Tax=Parascaris univalens TaxID=6257 RepID=A0A915A2C9_PARUN
PLLSRILDAFLSDLTNMKAKFLDHWDEVCLILTDSMEQMFAIPPHCHCFEKSLDIYTYCCSLFDVTLPLSKQECIKMKAFHMYHSSYVP